MRRVLFREEIAKNSGERFVPFVNPDQKESVRKYFLYRSLIGSDEDFFVNKNGGRINWANVPVGGFTSK